MTPADTLPLAYGTTFGKAVPHWAIRSVTWRGFCKLLDSPATSKTGALSYIPGTIVPGPGAKCKCSVFLHRTKETVRLRWALTLDADYCGNAGSGLIRNLKGLGSAVAVHTTWSSTEDDERYRVIIPLDRFVEPLEYSALARYMMDALGRGMFDATCDQHSRLMYLPARADGTETYWKAVMPGPFLDADFWLDLAGGPDKPTERVRPEPREDGLFTGYQYNQLAGLCVKMSKQGEGNRDNFLHWALMAAIDQGLDPETSGQKLAEAAVFAGLDEDVVWEKVGRILG